MKLSSELVASKEAPNFARQCKGGAKVEPLFCVACISKFLHVSL